MTDTCCIITHCPNVGINQITIKFKDSEWTGHICHAHHDELVERTARARRHQPCPLCHEPVDTWLSGTTAAHRTEKGVMHAECYLNERDQDAERSEAAPTQRPTGSS